MVTDSFNRIEWKNGIQIQNPTYFNANNLNSINSETVGALNELEREITGSSATILTIYKSLNLFPSPTGSVNPNGRGSGIVGDYSIAFGYGALASGENGITIGKNAVGVGDNSVVIGTSASASADNSIAIGNGANANAEGSIKISNLGSISDNVRAIFIGYLTTEDNSNILGANSISIGTDAKATGNSAIQLGTGVNSTANSLQVFNQNIYRQEIETIDENEYFTNNFAAIPGEFVKNIFLGDALGASTTLGPSDNIRNIEDVFEENSATVKNSTTALKAIPNALESPSEYFQFYYDDNSNILHTNLTSSAIVNEVEEVRREFLIYYNNTDTQYNSVADTRLDLLISGEGDMGTIQNGSLLKIELVDKTNVSYPKTSYVFMRINSNAEDAYETFSNSYIESDSLWINTWRLHYFKTAIVDTGYASFQLDSGYQTKIWSAGGVNMTLTEASATQYPIIKRIYKIY